ncbi:hypothetical protein PIROE2DRAFT_6789 [Piromyces sp. E2]|nr:hypothetical protein PIROE2DRAFT_6789 [Piromyces sp. E2]|eukprot:OUM66078.1 hypothetical protein PIROE2DRAFT_6789 [Piromyces sp. E2]
MQCNYIFTLLIIISLLLINITFAKSINGTLSNDDKIPKINKDQTYIIFINNTFGEIDIFKKPKNLKRDELEPYEFAFSLMDEIHDLIVENKDTYNNPEILEEIENNSKLKRRDNEEQPLTIYNNSKFVRPISSIGHSLVLSAYLSKYVANKVRTLKNIKAVLPDIKGKVSQNSYYNQKEILEETKWNSLAIQEQSSLHLSLLSQGYCHTDLISEYDKNYYYPDSAGEDIDIVIIDTSFNFEYSEFENYSNRTVKCVAYVNDNDSLVIPFESSTSVCGDLIHDHGQIVANMAGGSKNGAAKKANIYAISIPEDKDFFIYMEDVLPALQYVLKYLIRPHKTVVNISHRFIIEKDDLFYKQYKDVINEITNEGAIVVVSAGNEESDVDFNTSEEIDKSIGNLTIPCVFSNTICVGGIDSRQATYFDKNYMKANGSNYGKSIDIWAPFYVYTKVMRFGIPINFSCGGTSFSTPLTAGVIATIMSEFPDIEFTKNSMLKHLLKNATPFYFNDEVHYFINNGKQIVYSKDEKYYGCGILAGNKSCDNSTEIETTNYIKSKKYSCHFYDGEFIFDPNYQEDNNLDHACLVTIPDDKRKLSIYDTAWNFFDNHIKASYSESTVYNECNFYSEFYEPNVCFEKINNLTNSNGFFLSIDYYQEECERRSGIFLTDNEGDYICLMSYFGNENIKEKYCVKAGVTVNDRITKKKFCVNDLYTNYNVCNKIFSSEDFDKALCYEKILYMNLINEKIFFVEKVK